MPRLTVVRTPARVAVTLSAALLAAVWLVLQRRAHRTAGNAAVWAAETDDLAAE